MQVRILLAAFTPFKLSESMHDRVRRKWAGIVTGVMFAPDVASTSSQGEDSGSAAEDTTLDH